MINSNELKKGNKVYFTGNGENNVVEILELRKKECLVEYVGNEMCLFYDDEDIQPIPLSPEVLEAYGFNESRERPGTYTYKFSTLAAYLFGGIYEENYYVEYVNNDNSYSSLCHSLHSLQNLYFALTQTELIYSPKPT